MKKYITAALSLGTITLLFYTMFDLKEQVKQIEVLQKELDSVTIVKDSLYDVSFQVQVENGRYEMSLEHLKSVNPKAADEFENFYGHETE
jgi:flagellar motor switch/type III secretory pathway protein FliN